MLIGIYIIGGLALLIVGGEFLVRGAVALSKRLGLSTLVIGLTVVAFGTSSPELVVSAKAALEGFSSIALGNVIGSNISNIFLILGLTGMVFPIAIHRKVAGFDALAMLLATLLLIALCWYQSAISRIEGTILLISLIAYIIFTLRNAVVDKDSEHYEEATEQQSSKGLSVPLALVMTIVGIALLVVGAEYLIDGAIELATLMGVSDAVIAVTLVAFGSSAPELATSLVAAFRKHSDIAIGNIVGSNLFNLLGIMGVSTIITPIEVEQSFLYFDLWVLLGATFLLFVVMRKLPEINRWLACSFVFYYVVYVAKQFIV